VTQGPSSALQTRKFYYDSLGRLTGSTEPESGTVNYSYDNVGNLSTRKDARLITTSYSYDALNRLKQIGYSDGKTSTVTLGYDAAGVGNSTGQLTSMGNDTATLSWGPFSAVGQVLASSETTGGESYSFSYGYSLAGALTQETYPSGRVLTTGYDTANRPNQVTGARSGAQTSYAGNVSYFPHGGPSRRRKSQAAGQRSRKPPRTETQGQ